MRRRMLVTVSEKATAQRRECGSRVVELPGPLEQHPVDPARTAEDRAPPDLALEGKRALDRREWDSASTYRLVESHVGERARERPRFAKLLRQLEGSARASFADGDLTGFVEIPGKAPLGLDSQPEVVAHLAERRLEELRADVVALPEGANPGKPVERTGTITSAGRRGDDLLEQPARPLRLTRLEVALSRLDPSSVRLGGEFARGEAASLFPQCRRRVRGAAGARPPGRLAQFGRHGTVGTLGSEREMASAFLRIDEDRGK